MMPPLTAPQLKFAALVRVWGRQKAAYDTAMTVGRRHGRPVVLAVRACAMHRTALTCYRADNGVWLTDQVPVAFIRRLSGPPDGAA